MERTLTQEENMGLFSDPAFVCPICHGIEFVETEDRLTVRRCDCAVIRKSVRMLTKAGLYEAAKRCTFDSFQTDTTWRKGVLQRVREYAAQERPGWLFIGGQSGSGKTHLCTAAAVELVRRGREFRYMRWMNESAQIKAMGTDSERESRIHQFCTSQVLYIDDLFKSTPTEADKHIAFEILNDRYNDPNRVTIISSERTIDNLRGIDEALAGRIYEACRGNLFALTISYDPARNWRFGGERTSF